MIVIRHLIARRGFVLPLCAMALLVRLLLPTGYMIGSERGHIAVSVCTGMAQGATMTMAVPGPRGAHPASEHAKPDTPCAFAGLSAAAIDTIDPLMLATLSAFVLATGWRSSPVPLPEIGPYLRPPPRGPPALP